jgi:hypothetical protein
MAARRKWLWITGGYTGDEGDHMRVSTVREFRMQRELFEMLSTEIAWQIGKSVGTEEEVLADFESWRKTRRVARRRR